jgi:hypothetical protein
MSYKNLITKQVDKIFILLKDLVTPVELVKKNITGFNFAKGEVKTSPDAVLSVKAVILSSKKKNENTDTLSKSVLFKNVEIGNIKLFDEVIIDSEKWKIGPVISSNQYTTSVEIVKEI